MSLLKKSQVSQSAFTLIELIVVISIFTLLVSATVANYRSGNRQSQLRLAAQGLATNIRLAQSYAIGSKDFTDINHDSQTPKGGWGIYVNRVDPYSYKIVTDLNEDHLWDNSNDGLFREVSLPDNIVIDEITVNDGLRSQPVDDSAILFWPPDPQTFINGSSTNNIEISLKDRLSSTSDKAKVKVNFFGLVEVE